MIRLGQGSSLSANGHCRSSEHQLIMKLVIEMDEIMVQKAKMNVLCVPFVQKLVKRRGSSKIVSPVSVANAFFYEFDLVIYVTSV